MPSFAPKTRVEVYLPVRYEAAYQDTLDWVIREFTNLHGGGTVIENAGGYYLSKSNETIDDRVSLIYCDWAKRRDRNEALYVLRKSQIVSVEESLGRICVDRGVSGVA